MKLTHRGKIGRLPESIREEVNVRLRRGEKGRGLCDWLNSLPEVQGLLAEEFGGKPVREQNVSEWRRGGHQQWLRLQEARELMERLGTRGNEMAEMDAGAVLGTMTTFAAARYVVAVKKLEGQREDPAVAWNRMREFCQDLVALRRTEHLAQRLELEVLAHGRCLRTATLNDET
jgi:hypothetical protein